MTNGYGHTLNLLTISQSFRVSYLKRSDQREESIQIRHVYLITTKEPLMLSNLPRGGMRIFLNVLEHTMLATMAVNLSYNAWRVVCGWNRFNINHGILVELLFVVFSFRIFAKVIVSCPFAGFVKKNLKTTQEGNLHVFQCAASWRSQCGINVVTT